MRDTFEEESPLEPTKIDGINQQKARQAWAKLQEWLGEDQTLKHEKHVFYDTNVVPPA